MNHNEVIDEIFEISGMAELSFSEKGETLQQEIDTLSLTEVLDHLDFAGVISERFAHDSTEEKLFAKYCDLLMARGFQELGFNAYAIEERADSADVLAKGGGYELVGDAKAFRLSRTAKNQKDFKVESLNQWRKGADYAILLAPICQYPNTKSQIYSQAITYNVTLLSYTHLAFLIRSENVTPFRLKQLWELSGTLKSGKDAAVYWNSMAEMVVRLAGKSLTEWESAAQNSLTNMVIQAEEQIAFWQMEKNKIKQLSHEEATDLLIEALKIDSKIDVIAKTAGLEL
jgi:hypothetical protein